MKLVFLGLPGVGKGTQAKRLATELRVPHISTGDMFRDPVILQTEIGQRAQAIMKRGELVPDDVVDGMVAERLKKPDAAAGYVLDGYPRTLPQGEALERLLSGRRETLHAAVYLDAPEDVVVERLSGRRTCRGCGAPYHVEFQPPRRPGVCDACGSTELAQREDDRPEAIRNRLQVYQRQTGPLVPFYESRGLLRRVDGAGAPDTVFSGILAVVGRA